MKPRRIGGVYRNRIILICYIILRSTTKYLKSKSRLVEVHASYTLLKVTYNFFYKNVNYDYVISIRKTEQTFINYYHSRRISWYLRRLDGIYFRRPAVCEKNNQPEKLVPYIVYNFSTCSRLNIKKMSPRWTVL